MNTLRRCAFLPIALLASVGIGALQNSVTHSQGSVSALSMSGFFEGKWTYQARWSPDGHYVMFMWDDWVRQNVYVVATGGGAPVRISDSKSFIGNPSGNSAGEAPVWAPDGKSILYTQDGNAFLASVPEGKITKLFEKTEPLSSVRFSPNGREIAFGRGGDLNVLDLTTGAVRRLTHERRGDGGPQWSPDGRWLAFVSRPTVRISWSPDYSGSLLSYHWSKPGTSDVGIIPAAGGDVRWIAQSPDNEVIADWAPDSRTLLVERRSTDVKDRTLFLAAVEGSLKTLYKQHDDRFLASNDVHAFYSPDGSQVAFTSDQDGWNHLYVVAAGGGTPHQLTRGRFEVSYPSWTPDGQGLVFCATKDGTEQRHVYRVSLNGTLQQVTNARGVDVATHIAPSGDRVLYLHSDPTHIPDVWSAPLTGSDPPRQLTDAMSVELHHYAWQTPQIITYSSQADGLAIRAQLFVPPGLDRMKKYPAIVHTHQAAIYQEVYYGPGPQKDNVAWYGFHQRLAQLGYVVLNIDYRGSYGYGRDFRVGDYMDLGGNDARDVISGVEYLRSVGYVDMNRIGVYGMSYGGHMVLTLLTKFPDVFKAGIDIAGVADFKLNYESLYGPWILGRIGTPEQNADVYFEDSAINFLDRLKAPLMILHGTNDPNVTLLQSVMLIDQLLKKGKRFEFELYPGELHFFTKKRSWIDAFMKMERFMDEYVRHASAKASTTPSGERP
jgi:dipeptidyl aminopeptidase/acylaminoacyl peptidase